MTPTTPADLVLRLRELPDLLWRGISQVMLVDNRLSGLLFLAGVFWSSPRLGLGLVVGTLASTLAAVLLGADSGHIRSGLFGFNGALVGVALLVFLEPGVLAWAWLILAAACSSVLMAALMHLFERSRLPALTAPFVFTTMAFVLAAARFGRLDPSGLLPTASLPGTAVVEGVVTLASLGEGWLDGISQVFFQADAVSAALFVLGLLVASRHAALAALAGAACGALLAWGSGGAEDSIRAGVFGFNAVLTAIALHGVFFAPTSASFVYALFGSVVSTVLFAALSGALEPFGLPAMTLPFVLTTWIFVAAGSRFRLLETASA